MAVVAGAQVHRAAAQVVDAAVPDMCPVRLAALHQANGAGRTRPLFQREFGAERHDRLMRAPETELQETERVKQRLRQAPEHFQHDPATGFRRASAVSMPAHAIHHDQERGIVTDRYGNAVLVLFAIPDQAHVAEFKLHAYPLGQQSPTVC
jgi:hypothetical protein